MKEIEIAGRKIGGDQPTYFIADIGANHDGDLERAKDLIRLVAEAGGDAAKFQNFRAPEIVSDYGFRHMDAQVSHQAKWKKSVFPFMNTINNWKSGSTSTTISGRTRGLIIKLHMSIISGGLKKQEVMCHQGSGPVQHIEIFPFLC